MLQDCMVWPINSGRGPSEKLKDSKASSIRIQAMSCPSTERFKATRELVALSTPCWDK